MTPKAMLHQSNAPSAQPAIRPAARACAWLMHEAFPVLLTVLCLFGVLLLQSTSVQAKSAEHSGATRTERRAIKDLRPGDEVLALAEWKEPGSAKNSEGQRLDQRLSYEKVTDIVTSTRPETVLVHLTLDGGQTITATEGHPFKTVEGWRDAILLRKGGQLLLKGSGDEPPDAAAGSEHAERIATIADIRIEKRTVPAFNLEVANAHTFFVGDDGALVHNAKSPTSGNNPAAQRGQQAHRDPALGPPGSQMDVPLPGSKRRADFVDFKNRTIWEMKPCNARAMKRGVPQVDDYVGLANAATSGPFAGGGWRGMVFGGY